MTERALGEVPAVEELRNLTAQIKAYESEISQCKLYLANEDRFNAEMARELQLLEWQQARVDRLKSRRGEEGEANLNKWHDMLAAAKQRMLVVKNQAAIETLLRLQRELNDLNGTGQHTAVTMAACNAAVTEVMTDTEQEHKTSLACDGCDYTVVANDSDELDGTPCPRCRTGILTEVNSEDSDTIAYSAGLDEELDDLDGSITGDDSSSDSEE